ncbi:hypothetical protein CP532_2914 [Ophiocordyceps camponoti-leonardi (nom. inval.)]|nr:hypothetical protein CP532_2914 [Ophiocordyceps camponoti-leonardi (nom. inval.)]
MLGCRTMVKMSSKADSGYHEKVSVHRLMSPCSRADSGPGAGSDRRWVQRDRPLRNAGEEADRENMELS